MEPRTLVLNAWMRPHSILGWQQAIGIIDILSDGRCIVVGKADTLETYDATVSSPSITIRIPAVVRLRREVSPHKNGVKFSRINVYARDGFRCQYCGDKKPTRELNYDHVVPRHQGGKTTWANIVAACHKCNLKKRNRTPEQAGMPLRRKPFIPKTLPMAAPFLLNLDNVPELWAPYIEATMAQVTA